MSDLAGRTVIWALPPSLPAPPGTGRLFPNESETAARLAPKTVALLQTAPSGFFDALAQASAAPLERTLGQPAALVLAREPSISIAYLFLDRLLRIDALVSRHGAPRLAVGSPAKAPPPPHQAALQRAAASDPDFNQSVAARLAAVWNLPVTEAPIPWPIRPPAAPSGNVNFLAPGWKARIAWKARRLLSKGLGRVPATHLAYAEPDLLDAGLIGPFGLALLERLPLPVPPSRDAGTRSALFEAAAGQKEGLEVLLRALGMGAGPAERAATLFPGFFAEFFPSDRLEGASGGLDAARRLLAPFAGRPLLLSETMGPEPAFLMAAARSLGMSVVGVQHSAHYGFAAPASFLELEYPFLDAFVTWGWTRQLPDPRRARVERIPLPTPWLSGRVERERANGSSQRPKSPRWDVLLVTDRLQSFPPALSTIRMSRLDFLDATGRWLEAGVLALAANGLKVLHKPFNAESAEIQSGTTARLRAGFPTAYEVAENLDKGLSGDLLARCGCVVWDEPGSGFFECLAAGVPTLLLWTREVSRETPEAEALFASLEAVGVAHRRAETLAAQAGAIRSAPESWRDAPERARAVGEFLRALAWTDPDWAGPWRKFIRSL